MNLPQGSDVMERLKRAILKGDYESAVACTQGALEAGTPAAAILSEGMMPAMEQLGADFSAGVVFLPELIAGGHAMSEAAGLFAGQAADGRPAEEAAVVALGTAEGDIHDIGKNIVAITMRAAGLEVLDLGVDVSVERFVEAARRPDVRLVGISALLTSTMRAIEAAVREIHENSAAKVLVGGAPVTEDYAREIGADGYAPDAYLAAHTAVTLVAAQAKQQAVQAGDRP